MLDGFSVLKKRMHAGYIVTFVRKVNEQELLRRFGGDPTRAWLIPCADLDALTKHRGYRAYRHTELFEFADDLWNRPWIQVGACDDWAFALERGVTDKGSCPESLCKISLGTVAVSIHHNWDHGSTYLKYAVNGVLLAEVYPAGWSGDPTLVQELFRQAGVDPESEEYSPREAMIAIAEGIGVRFHRNAVMGLMLTGEISSRP
jgi:hypothetical protein